MADPFNQLPIDPEWVALADRLTREMAASLGAMVVAVIVQPGGKMGVTVEGAPESGPLRKMSQNVPLLLAHLALVCRSMDAHAARAEKH